MAGRKFNSAPELKVLSPTTEVYQVFVHRLHLQTAIWKLAMDADPPSLPNTL